MPKMTTGKEKPKVVFTVQMAWHNHNLPFISSQTGVRLRTIQWLVHCFKEAGEATHYFSSLKVCALIFRQVATAKREKEKNTRPTRPWEVGQMQHLCCPQPNSCWSRNKREIVVSIFFLLVVFLGMLREQKETKYEQSIFVWHTRWTILQLMEATHTLLPVPCRVWKVAS